MIVLAITILLANKMIILSTNKTNVNVIGNKIKTNYIPVKEIVGDAVL